MTIFPWKGWALQDSSGVLIASQATGTFGTERGLVTKTVYVTEGTYTFEITHYFPTASAASTETESSRLL
jgi:hypothetical protein